jgi:hypothetical protein
VHPAMRGVQHWVCATLARLGWAPALTRDGIARTDILAVGTHFVGRPRIEIQVKTSNVPSPDSQIRENFQLLRVKGEIARSEHEWFAFVLIPPFPQALRTFIVPRNHVCAAVWIEWRILTNYLDSKQQCDDKSKQVWSSWVTWQRYEERWDLLGTATSDIPVMLSVYYRYLVKNNFVDLPPGHPWDEEFPEWPEFWGDGSGSARTWPSLR